MINGVLAAVGFYGGGCVLHHKTHAGMRINELVGLKVNVDFCDTVTKKFWRKHFVFLPLTCSDSLISRYL